MGSTARYRKKAVSSSQRVTNPLVRAHIDHLWETGKANREFQRGSAIPAELAGYAKMVRKADRARSPKKVEAYTEKAYELLHIALSDYPRLRVQVSMPKGVEEYDSLPRFEGKLSKVKPRKQIRDEVLERFRTYPHEFEPEAEPTLREMEQSRAPAKPNMLDILKRVRGQ